MRVIYGMLALAIVCVPDGNAMAQERTACVAAIGPDTVAPRVRETTHASATASTNPDVVILASVTADEVRFAKSPQICVRLTGDARFDTLRIVGRRNLSSPVVAGTSYRNVYVAVEILGHLNADCIAARITRAGADSLSNCASLGVRTSNSIKQEN